MTKSSMLVIVIPLCLAGAILAGVFWYNAQQSQDAPVVVSTQTVVPELKGVAGKPQNGFAVSELATNAVLDLSQELEEVSDDTAVDDFAELQSEVDTL